MAFRLSADRFERGFGQHGFARRPRKFETSARHLKTRQSRAGGNERGRGPGQGGPDQGIAAEGAEGRYARGETSFTYDEPGDAPYIVLEGNVKLGRRAADRQESILWVMGPSNIFGELALRDPGPRPATATIATHERLV